MESSNEKAEEATSEDSFTDVPRVAMCPECQCPVTTELTYKPGTKAVCWIMTSIYFGLLCGCCLIPLFIRQCKDVYHVCPDCHTVIGYYVRPVQISVDT